MSWWPFRIWGKITLKIKKWCQNEFLMAKMKWGIAWKGLSTCKKILNSSWWPSWILGTVSFYLNRNVKNKFFMHKNNIEWELNDQVWVSTWWVLENKLEFRILGTRLVSSQNECQITLNFSYQICMNRGITWPNLSIWSKVLNWSWPYGEHLGFKSLSAVSS